MAFMNEISENFQKKTDMLVRKEVIIKLVLFSFLFLIVLVFLGESRKKYILSESRHAFSAAVMEEKNLFIQEVSFQYKAEYSPNNISAEAIVSKIIFRSKNIVRPISQLVEKQMNYS